MDPRQVSTKLRELLTHIQANNGGRRSGTFETNRFSIITHTSSDDLPPAFGRFNWNVLPQGDIYSRNITVDDATRVLSRDPRGQGGSLQLAILGTGYYDYNGDGSSYENVPFYVTLAKKSPDKNDDMKFALYLFDLKQKRWVQVNGERETDNVRDIFKTMSKVFLKRSLKIRWKQAVNAFPDMQGMPMMMLLCSESRARDMRRMLSRWPLGCHSRAVCLQRYK